MDVRHWLRRVIRLHQEVLSERVVHASPTRAALAVTELSVTSPFFHVYYAAIVTISSI